MVVSTTSMKAARVATMAMRYGLCLVLPLPLT